MSTLSSIYLLSVRLCTLPDVKVKLESYLGHQAGICSQDQHPGHHARLHRGCRHIFEAVQEISPVEEGWKNYGSSDRNV